IHAITLDIPPGNPLQEQKLSIEIEYLLLHPNDPEHHKTAKKEINRQLCETAESFTWVTFKNPYTPPDWSRISFNQDNNGYEWPSPRVSER
ncbi:MAG: hypothetical protein HY747_02555, partial [Elusimicrobia bacterium]|nr:hypothetical protein [Elusimicrobiota bacterium]